MGPLFSNRRHEALQRLVCRAAGVRLLSDVHERGCDLGLSLPLGPARRGRLERIAATGLLFVHIPKVAGMSISQALYGVQVKHASIRLLHHVADGRLAMLPSFAVLRDPADRFLSAFRYGRAGGSAINDVAEPFRSLYRRFESIDEALDHVEQAESPYQIDHIFRPQHWYVTDRLGRIAVDRLVRMDDLARLPRLIPGFPDGAMPRLNRGNGEELTLDARQRRRLERLYAADFALWQQAQAGTARRRAPPRPDESIVRGGQKMLVPNPLPFRSQSPI